MATKKKATPREKRERYEQGQGIVRDKQSGIVLARQRKHPLAHLFRSIPMGQPGLPAMNLPEEMTHLLAIHTFDNLDCSPPRQPRYRYVDDPQYLASMGMRGGTWVPIGSAAPQSVPPPEPEPVPDVSEYSPAQLAALESAIRARKVAERLAANLDPHVQPEGQGGAGG